MRRLTQNRPKPNYALLLMLFCISALVSCAASFAVQTPALTVREVKVQGVHLANRAEVQRAAKSALGQNIILLRKSPIIRRIARLSEVQSVQMGRSLPDKVWIRLIERKPDAVLTLCRGYCLVRCDGLAFHIGKEPASGVPLICVADCGRVRVGEKCRSPRVSSAIEVVRLARKNGLVVSKISVDHAGDMCLNMGGKFYVRLGQPDDIPSKIAKLRDVLYYKPSIAQEAEYVDLSCPSAPAMKPKLIAGAAS